MNQINNCPECTKPISLQAKSCSCGWLQRDKKNPMIIDYRCQYKISEKRCPSLGTVCQFPYGSGPWYCSEHWRTRSERKL